MISAATHETYLKNARSLERSFRRRGLPRVPESYADEIKRRSAGLHGSSLRMYRRSAIYRLESIGDGAGAMRLRALLEASDMAAGERRRLVRRVPDELARALVEQLAERGTKIALRTRDLLVATIVTGLRPSEWSDAEVHEGVLVVANAKFKEGVRGNGEVRELELLSTVSAAEIDAITACIAAFRTSPYARQRPNIAVAFKEALGPAIRAAGVSKWFYRLRLYDFRHQFAADAKSSWGVGAGLVAAAMGHSVEDTAVEHYGRTKHGSGKSKVKPTGASVAKVRRLYDRNTPAHPPRPMDSGPIMG